MNEEIALRIKLAIQDVTMHNARSSHEAAPEVASNSAPPHDSPAPLPVAACSGTCAQGTNAQGTTVHVSTFLVETFEGISLERRAFLSKLAFSAAALALAACTSNDSLTSPTVVNGSIKVADFSALANVGGVATMSLQGSPIAVVRTGTSSFLALSRVCPHQGTTINVSGSGFVCPNHGATFNASGTWTGGERTSSLRSYATAYDALNGVLTIG